MEHLFIYPVLLFVTYLLYKVLKMKAGRNRLRKGGALPPIQTDMRKSVRDTTYMETVFPAEFKEHPDDADFFPDFAKMDIPENLGETLIEALSNSGIPETDAIGTSVEETTGLQASPVLKQFKQEDMENKDLLKGMENASAYREMISMSPEPADEKEVMGKTRFVYLDENAGKTAAPYMSQPLEQGTDYIGEDEEIREEDVECLLPLEEMELLRKEQEELDSALPETEVITQAVTLEEFSLVGDVLMRVNGADQDADKRSSAARTLFAIRNTSLFDLFISQVGNEEAVNKLLEENLDEDGNPRPLKKGGKRNNGGVDWRELV